MKKKNWFICPDCEKQRTCKQGPKYKNFDLRTWSCKCGNTETEVDKK